MNAAAAHPPVVYVRHALGNLQTLLGGQNIYDSLTGVGSQVIQQPQQQGGLPGYLARRGGPLAQALEHAEGIFANHGVPQLRPQGGVGIAA